jgi:hypothetical protein
LKDDALLARVRPAVKDAKIAAHVPDAQPHIERVRCRYRKVLLPRVAIGISEAGLRVGGSFVQ